MDFFKILYSSMEPQLNQLRNILKRKKKNDLNKTISCNFSINESKSNFIEEFDKNEETIIEKLLSNQPEIKKILNNLSKFQQSYNYPQHLKNLISKFIDFITFCEQDIWLLHSVFTFVQKFIPNQILFICLRNKYIEVFFKNFTKLYQEKQEIAIYLKVEILFIQVDLENRIIYQFFNEIIDSIEVNELDNVYAIHEIIENGKKINGVIVDSLEKKYERSARQHVDLKEIKLADVNKNPRAFCSRPNRHIYRGVFYEGEAVVIKEFSGLIGQKEYRKYEQEAEFLQIFSGKKPCFLNFFGVIKEKNSFSIVMEGCPCSMQTDVTYRKKNQIYYGLNEFKSIAIDLLEGLDYMQNARICHRDIKPQNIFLKEGFAKLGDFSISDYYLATSRVTCRGTDYYIAPEVKKLANGVSFCCDLYKADVYSLGITFHEILFLKKYTEIQEVLTDFSSILVDPIRIMLTTMVDISPEKRPSFLDCLKILQGAG